MALSRQSSNYLLPSYLERVEIVFRRGFLKGEKSVGLNDKVLVAGGGGFIGGALIALLRKQGLQKSSRRGR